MMPRANPPLVFCVALAVSAMGAAPPFPSDAPVEAKSSPVALSSVTRLGIKFSPTTKDGEKGVSSPSVTPLVFHDPIAPGTVLLAPFIVTEKRVKLTEDEILTDKGRLELAMKQQLTPLYRKTFGPLTQLATYYFNWPSIFAGWHPNEVEAMILYRQEQEIKNRVEMDRLLKLEAVDDAKETKLSEPVRANKPAHGFILHLSN